MSDRDQRQTERYGRILAWMEKHHISISQPVMDPVRRIHIHMACAPAMDERLMCKFPASEVRGRLTEGLSSIKDLCDKMLVELNDL